MQLAAHPVREKSSSGSYLLITAWSASYLVTTPYLSVMIIDLSASVCSILPSLKNTHFLPSSFSWVMVPFPDKSHSSPLKNAFPDPSGFMIILTPISGISQVSVSPETKVWVFPLAKAVVTPTPSVVVTSSPLIRIATVTDPSLLVFDIPFSVLILTTL